MFKRLCLSLFVLAALALLLVNIRDFFSKR